MNRTGAALLSAAVAVSTFVIPIESAAATPAPAATSQRLTNLAHLDYLADRVAERPSAAHTTYRLARDPNIGVLWVYANHQDDGTFRRVGGGDYDAATNTYAQGAYDTDDIARAAVVYLRQWQATGSSHAKEQAYQQLRGLAYFQTLTGPKAGEVVLWMQPNGALNPSPIIKDNPDPSDSDASYWLARTLWAYGEGYAAFRHSDPAFAAFLAARMALSLRALNRDVLTDYGKYQVLHGVRVPAWLIGDGADASSEAALGIAAYVKAGGPGAGTALTALAELTRGITELSAGSTTTYPYRALLPWALSRSQWHAWGAQMASGLAAAYPLLGRRELLKTAVADTAGFTAQLLTSTGPVNGMQPTVTNGAQIAYGADGRVQALYAVSRLTRSIGLRDLAGVAAGWFFGANPAGVPVYDPSTGVTNDGVEADGRVNGNSGAESTIHGLLTMQLLDAHPDLATLARQSAHIAVRDGLTTVEAETGTLTGAATVVTPKPQWTGDAQWSGDAVVAGRRQRGDLDLARRRSTTAGPTRGRVPAGSRRTHPVHRGLVVRHGPLRRHRRAGCRRVAELAAAGRHRSDRSRRHADGYRTNLGRHRPYRRPAGDAGGRHPLGLGRRTRHRRADVQGPTDSGPFGGSSRQRPSDGQVLRPQRPPARHVDLAGRYRHHRHRPWRLHCDHPLTPAPCGDHLAIRG